MTVRHSHDGKYSCQRDRRISNQPIDFGSFERTDLIRCRERDHPLRNDNYHGEGFALFRDSVFSAPLPGPPSPYQRNQDGGNFWRSDSQSDKTVLLSGCGTHRQPEPLAAIVPAPPSDVHYTGNTGTPFRETDTHERPVSDFNLWQNVRLFYRFSYFDSKAVATGGAVGYQPFQDENYTRTHGIGADLHNQRVDSRTKLPVRISSEVPSITWVITVLAPGLPFANFPVSS